MKKQKIILYLVILVCFTVCLAVLNKKYDRFYRINGIDNENRQLILNHLNEEEQAYLVENSFPMDRFIRFIKDPNFNLLNLEYYEAIENKKQWQQDITQVIDYTNQYLAKLQEDNPDLVYHFFYTLLEKELDEVYLNCEAFDVHLIDLYETHLEIKNQEITGDDIVLLNQINENLDKLHYTLEQRINFLKTYDDQYRLQDLLLYTDLCKTNSSLKLVMHPNSLTAIIPEGYTVASYEPSPLALTNVIRTRFGTYLRQDATASLVALMEACEEAIKDETLLLVDAYQPYEQDENNDMIDVGNNEFQLGLSVDFMVMDIRYRDFEATAMSDYLKAHSWEFGFIQRYPDTTKDTYSANIYRFVGKDAAKVIHEKHLTLEAYEGLNNG